MLARHRGELAVIVALVAMVAVEAFALRASSLGIVVIGVLAGLALVIVVSRADLARIGVGAALTCAFTLTWNGWFVGPVRPGDVLVLIALACFALGAPAAAFRTPPWWIKQLVFALMLLVVLVVLLPPDPHYLVQRTVLDAGGKVLPQFPVSVSTENIGIAAKFIVAVAALPMAFTASVLVERRSLRWLALAFPFGAALSGLAAFIDHTHIASVGHFITHLPNISDRQVGFASHPNFLAAGLVLAIPFACWLMVSTAKREQRAGAAALLFLVLGVYASGSRGGAVCAVGAVILTFLLLPRTRPHLPGILLAGVVGAGIMAVALPSVGMQILEVTRLAGNPNTTGSDIVRAQVGAQGIRDFHFSPIKGIGLQASTDASQVYIQELASGGLILFIAMSLYMLGAGRVAWTVIDRTPLAAAILGSIGATLGLNLFEADLTDRFYYVPEAILVALLVTLKTDDRAAPPPEATAPRDPVARASRQPVEA